MTSFKNSSLKKGKTQLNAIDLKLFSKREFPLLRLSHLGVTCIFSDALGLSAGLPISGQPSGTVAKSTLLKNVVKIYEATLNLFIISDITFLRL
jgi:hypothetical protein